MHFPGSETRELGARCYSPRTCVESRRRGLARRARRVRRSPNVSRVHEQRPGTHVGRAASAKSRCRPPSMRRTTWALPGEVLACAQANGGAHDRGRVHAGPRGDPVSSPPIGRTWPREDQLRSEGGCLVHQIQDASAARTRKVEDGMLVDVDGGAAASSASRSSA